jgi:hypothetical protein
MQHFHLTAVCLWFAASMSLQAADLPRVEFHTSPVFLYNEQYLSFNQILDRSAGTIDVELMSSRDGLRWDRSFANH